ncbi:hypothetical protein VC83_02500 [Pseudogymnoascus destructans]|uniref:Uncharacterized protein n=1 Tax=Pseudogymnoascus destructans TaxID=655981 RepID=A0A177AHY3_9PEZI|nr:uncharacterized protein VC83_02500 [Pseudogymnoascus destructans]OAF60911.1 hypothetical protein VC83_02500 [Pseudogymnoascus destructans]
MAVPAETVAVIVCIIFLVGIAMLCFGICFIKNTALNMFPDEDTELATTAPSRDGINVTREENVRHSLPR